MVFNNMKHGVLILLGIILGFWALIIGIQYGIYKVSYDVVTVTIQDKERVTTGSGENMSSKYLIYTDQGVFENTDHLVTFKFDSSDLYGKLKLGETCRMEVTGWRVPFLSMYRNILTASCKSQAQIHGEQNAGY